MFSSDKWFGASAGFYSETIDQSLRFNVGDSPYLSRTFGTATSATQGTWSCWFKRGLLGTQQILWSASNYEFVQIGSDDTITVTYLSNIGYITTFAKYRDTTNWYNLVVTFDTPNATEEDRLRIYVNGVRQDVYDSITRTQNATFQRWNVSGYTGHIGNFQYNNTLYFNGYLAECNWIDGTALDASYFGETKNGVWIPKAISGLTYGNNGFRLTFADSSSLGDDTSGNTNDFASSGLASTDVVIDSPTNNWCTWNASNNFGIGNLTEGATKWAVTGSTSTSTNEGIDSTFAMPTTGKWYWEYHAQDKGYLSHIGLTSAGTNLNNTGTSDGTRASWSFGTWHATYNGNNSKYTSTAGGSSGSTWSVGNVTDGQVLGCAYDADNGTLWFSRAGTFLDSSGTANPATNTDPRFSGLNDGTQWFAYNSQYASGSPDFFVNFGQDSSFAGSKTSGSSNAQDDNGIGDFYYSPPSGFLALCSANLPDTTISPNQSTQADDYFITTTYSGDSNNSTQISTGFQPDWVWIKNRTEGSSDGSGEHMLYDSSRGVHDDLNSNNTSAEDTNTNGLQEFGSTFFRPGSLTRTNETGDTYVAWNWKANGGTTSSNSDGSITSTVQANTTAGFSIVTYTGNGSNGTIGHGLGAVPQMMIVKLRNASGGSWIVYHHLMGSSPEDLRMFLDSTSASGTSTANFNSTAPTSTVFSVGNTTATNGSSNTYVAYLFAEVEGYSKFGSYTGNGSTDGTFVYTGFRPAWVMLKRTNGSYHWVLMDSVSDPTNPIDSALLPSGTNVAGTGYTVDFLSNGFKLRLTGTAMNASGAPHIFMAFAEQPFKFSNAR